MYVDTIILRRKEAHFEQLCNYICRFWINIYNKVLITIVNKRIRPRKSLIIMYKYFIHYDGYKMYIFVTLTWYLKQIHKVLW